MAKPCVPVLLGSDINAYGMARSFYERYQVRSHALTGFPLMPTRDSDILDVHVIPELDTEQVFLDAVLGAADDLAEGDLPLVLIACGDTYADLVSKHREALAARYTLAAIDHELLTSLTNKAAFYRMCDTHGLDHPATYVVTAADVAAGKPVDAQFGFPRAVKPADSVEYLNVDFPGRKKAYVVGSQAEMDAVIAQIYGAGYTAELIIQDFIPGGDEQMRVLNAYVGKDGKVQMMCLGHPLLEDYQPASIGNYTVIMTDNSEGVGAVYKQVAKFLTGIGYTGFANFDMKFDSRDGSYKFFELNPRQGRSSFFVTLAGRNLAECFVADRVLDEPRPLQLGGKDVVWLGVPKLVFKKYAAAGTAKSRAQQLIAAGKWGSTLWYSKDKNLKRKFRISKMYLRYVLMYRKYFGDRSYEQADS